VLDAAHMTCEFAGYQPKIKLLKDMPTGPMNRVADNSLGKKLLGWQPQVAFRDGLKRTMDWYFSTKDREQVAKVFSSHQLTER